MRVLIADTSPEVRWALRTVIREEPELTLVGEVSDSEHLLSLAATLQPDLILLEWELTDRPRQDLLAHFVTRDPGCRIIVLSHQPEAREAALTAGAVAFVNKVDSPEQLLATLRRLGRE